MIVEISRHRSMFLILILALPSILLLIGIMALPFSKESNLFTRFILPLCYSVILYFLLQNLSLQVSGKYIITNLENNCIQVSKKHLLNSQIHELKDAQMRVENHSIGGSGPKQLLILIGFIPKYEVEIFDNNKSITLRIDGFKDIQVIKKNITLNII